jgi:hypothetical protein
MNFEPVYILHSDPDESYDLINVIRMEMWQC